MKNDNRGKNGGLVLLESRKPALLHPGHQPAGSYDRPDLVLSDGLYRAVRLHVTEHYTPTLAAQEPAPILVVQGLPGEGKTKTVMATCSRLGIDCIVVAAAELAGATANAGVAVLAEICDAARTITERDGRMVVIIIDDADLGSWARLGNTEYTVDSQLMTEQWQFVGDGRGVRSKWNLPVPFIWTGNDFTPLRRSLLREGRAEFYTHTPSPAEKASAVAALYGLDGDSGATLVAEHPERPLAFFGALRAKLWREVVEALLAEHGLDPATLEEKLRGMAASVVTLDKLRAAAREQAASCAAAFV